jgi:hypothetical protein
MRKKSKIQVIDLKKRRFNKKKALAFAVIVLSLALVGMGFTRTKISTFDKALWESEDYKFEELITELQLIEDATFSGVEYIDGELFSTYDRTQKKAKRACPT